MRSQAGPGAGIAPPAGYLTQILLHLFRVILLRRLLMRLLPSLHRCWCGRPIESFGHHRAACARSGVLGRRELALDSSAGGRVCREAGGRVSTDCLMRDLDFPMFATDSRRLDVVVDGRHLFGCCQLGSCLLAVDTTLVCAMHCDGTPHDGAPDREGVALEAARRRKERRSPELVGPRSRARLVVLAVEVGGRWSAETCSIWPSLRWQILAWRLRWAGIFGCAAAKAVATSLLELKVAHVAERGHDGLRPNRLWPIRCVCGCCFPCLGWPSPSTAPNFALVALLFRGIVRKMTSEKPKRAIWVGKSLEPRPQFRKKDLQREQKERNWRWERKKARNVGSHPSSSTHPSGRV